MGVAGVDEFDDEDVEVYWLSFREDVRNAALADMRVATEPPEIASRDAKLAFLRRQGVAGVDQFDESRVKLDGRRDPVSRDAGRVVND